MLFRQCVLHTLMRSNFLGDFSKLRLLRCVLLTASGSSLYIFRVPEVLSFSVLVLLSLLATANSKLLPSAIGEGTLKTAFSCYKLPMFRRYKLPFTNFFISTLWRAQIRLVLSIFSLLSVVRVFWHSLVCKECQHIYFCKLYLHLPHLMLEMVSLLPAHPQNPHLAAICQHMLWRYQICTAEEISKWDICQR
jgi:hypothetical protein